jgi:malate synthase
MSEAGLQYRRGILEQYPDVLTPAVQRALAALAHFNPQRRQLMHERIARRAARARERRACEFLEPSARIPHSDLTVAQARAGQFEGSAIPHDLERQWIQGTGPAARPRAALEENLRSVAYALLSGADGWMFDGEDALGQLSSMSLDNQRSLRIAFAGLAPFPKVAAQVAEQMNAWAQDFLGRRIIDDVGTQLEFTTRIFRARGLHLDDRHVRDRDGSGFSASIVDACSYVVNNAASLRAAGRSLVLYLPKLQSAAEAGLWQQLLAALETHAELPAHSIKTYVLVEQLEASFQLMEIRAALSGRFVGFNTGRWDYINSVSDALAWDASFQNPNIDAVTMSYGYMRVYEDRVRRAVNTPDQNGRCALWQGGMEPNIPVGSSQGVANGMQRALAGAERECAAGASGKWVAHWKMVHIVRPVWERAGLKNQLGRAFPPLAYTPEAAAELRQLPPAPRTVRGARDLISVALQYGNAFLRGFQAAALKPADSFADPDVLYLMEDMATGEIRLSILWEWLHKRARFSAPDAPSGIDAAEPFSEALFVRWLEEEYQKLRAASNRDVHDDSKQTTLPIAREIVERYVLSPSKLPWYIDLLNLNLDNGELAQARERITAYVAAFNRDGTRLTHNPDFER